MTWGFSKNGFFSVVAYDPAKDVSGVGKAMGVRSKSSHLQVRARVREHLEDVKMNYLPDIVIYEDTSADYSVRTIIHREDWKWFLARQVDEIDYYGHFKEASRDAVSGDKQKWYSAVMSIWGTMAGLQKYAPYGGYYDSGWSSGGTVAKTTTAPTSTSLPKPTAITPAPKPTTLEPDSITLEDMIELLQTFAPKSVPDEKVNAADHDAFEFWCLAEKDYTSKLTNGNVLDLLADYDEALYQETIESLPADAADDEVVTAWLQAREDASMAAAIDGEVESETTELLDAVEAVLNEDATTEPAPEADSNEDKTDSKESAKA